MRTKKPYIILIAILVIFFIVMFLVFGVDELKKDTYNTTIIIGDNTVWTYKNKKWVNDYDFSNLSWKKYDVFVDNQKSGNYYLWYSNKWYAFDDNKSAVLLDDGNLFAYRATYDIPVYAFENTSIDDYSYVYDVLEDNSIPTTSEFTVEHKIVLDYDNDGKEEEFYVVSNAFPMDFDPASIFSIVFMVKNDKVYPIYTDVKNNTGFNGCKPYIETFADVDNDSKYEFVLSCAKYSTSSVTKMLYDFSDNEFKILISNNK